MMFSLFLISLHLCSTGDSLLVTSVFTKIKDITVTEESLFKVKASSLIDIVINCLNTNNNGVSVCFVKTDNNGVLYGYVNMTHGEDGDLNPGSKKMTLDVWKTDRYQLISYINDTIEQSHLQARPRGTMNKDSSGSKLILDRQDKSKSDSHENTVQDNQNPSHDFLPAPPAAKVGHDVPTVKGRYGRRGKGTNGRRGNDRYERPRESSSECDCSSLNITSHFFLICAQNLDVVQDQMSQPVLFLPSERRFIRLPYGLQASFQDIAVDAPNCRLYWVHSPTKTSNTLRTSCLNKQSAMSFIKGTISEIALDKKRQLLFSNEQIKRGKTWKIVQYTLPRRDRKVLTDAPFRLIQLVADEQSETLYWVKDKWIIKLKYSNRNPNRARNFNGHDFDIFMLEPESLTLFFVDRNFPPSIKSKPLKGGVVSNTWNFERSVHCDGFLPLKGVLYVSLHGIDEIIAVNMTTRNKTYIRYPFRLTAGSMDVVRYFPC